MKRILIVLLCCMVTLGAYASKPVNLGLRFGWANSSLSIKDGDWKKYLDDANGFSLGAYVRVNMKKFYVEPAVDYTFMKSESSVSETKINYIQVPVMLGYRILDAKILKLRGFVGPEVSFLAKDVDKVFDAPEGLVNGSMNSVSWNGRVGIGIDIWKLMCNVDYKFALSKTGDGFGKSKGFNVTLGFNIF